MSYYNQLMKFLKQSLTDDQKTTSNSYLNIYLGLKVKISFGQGAPAKIPWISFLGENQSTSKGIYPAYLYYKKEGVLILAYGISETEPPLKSWDLKSSITINDYFNQHKLGKPFKYGDSLINKVYNIEDLPKQEVIDNDLKSIIDFYKSLNLNKFSKVELVNKKDKASFSINTFTHSIIKSGLFFDKRLILRFIGSILTKPFLILTGLSGSGKTKIAQSFATWICESQDQYKIVPVGADWTNREPLLGYPNGLDANEYITPDSGVIHLLLNAIKPENENRPFFLILDEMNLSHVERYFADFLSIMESNDTIKLYTGNTRKSLDGLSIPLEIGWPKNVFIIGTVNIDETTYMFSPKVLDRANVIEFRITDSEIQSFLENPDIPDLTKLAKQGVSMSESFLSIASQNNIVKNEDIAKELVSFFKQLQPVGAEFGYRSATEIMQLAAKLKMLEPSVTDDDCLDIAIMQKLLPKLHGSRSKLVKILIALAGLCIEGIKKEDFEKNFEDFYKKDFEDINVRYPISFEKLIRMYKNVLGNGFTSYAEA
jgi:5-methylcytosine-specific restriction enzyme B